MLLEHKTAVVYGGGGAIGGAVARAYAREGARVFLAGRTRASLDAVVEDIAAHGGKAEATEVDALDERAVDRHADEVVERAAGGQLRDGVRGGWRAWPARSSPSSLRTGSGWCACARRGPRTRPASGRARRGGRRGRGDPGRPADLAGGRHPCSSGCRAWPGWPRWPPSSPPTGASAMTGAVANVTCGAIVD